MDVAGAVERLAAPHAMFLFRRTVADPHEAERHDLPPFLGPMPLAIARLFSNIQIIRSDLSLPCISRVSLKLQCIVRTQDVCAGTLQSSQ